MARGHRPHDETIGLFDRSAPRPRVSRRTGLDLLGDRLDLSDLSDEATQQALTHTWDSIGILVRDLCALSDVEAPAHESDLLRVLLDHDVGVRGPFISEHVRFLMRIADVEVTPLEHLERERLFGGLNTQIRRYNDLVIGVPEVFVAFRTPDLRTEQLVARVTGIAPVHMERWRGRISWRMPEYDPEDWIDDWSHHQMHEVVGVVEAPYRVALAALGRALHRITGGYRFDRDSGDKALYARAEDALLKTPLSSGDQRTIRDLIAADPQRWIPRLPALADHITGKGV